MGEDAPELRPEVRAAWRWAPWLLAGVYVPVYLALDLTVGGSLGAAAELPRSVAVSLTSLAIACIVTAAVVVGHLEWPPAADVAAAVRNAAGDRFDDVRGLAARPHSRGPTSGGTPAGEVASTGPTTGETTGSLPATDEARRNASDTGDATERTAATSEASGSGGPAGGPTTNAALDGDLDEATQPTD
jgi:hypothetical protein